MGVFDKPGYAVFIWLLGQDLAGQIPSGLLVEPSPQACGGVGSWDRIDIHVAAKFESSQCPRARLEFEVPVKVLALMK